MSTPAKIEELKKEPEPVKSQMATLKSKCNFFVLILLSVPLSFLTVLLFVWFLLFGLLSIVGITAVVLALVGVLSIVGTVCSALGVSISIVGLATAIIGCIITTIVFTVQKVFHYSRRFAQRFIPYWTNFEYGVYRLRLVTEYRVRRLSLSAYNGIHSLICSNNKQPKL
ncbi:hypothetical protein SJAG_05336 [Schizosaccharomyces japonicus yFS275]|uniref:Uncharacterized protein n=1 Tax=Schizosaccharomyces japonicus (strain yFS275 / FY16936) TaxID=402676 RepID=B6K7A5_SCHJY|nr:hypothetical protein SJAG_05336 [Schizosaccharomyces japonicus yFS275]EEB09409.1 hypothetical protein SJAG_05336 [Schizosaccharomyces japonicus yFS275]